MDSHFSLRDLTRFTIATAKSMDCALNLLSDIAIPLIQVKFTDERQVKLCLRHSEALFFENNMKLSVPHPIVPKAHFTHEVCFTGKGHFTFRRAEHLVQTPKELYNSLGVCGAGNRDRTGTRLPSRDFKSRASANSATPAQVHGSFAPVRVFIIACLREKCKVWVCRTPYFP